MDTGKTLAKQPADVHGEYDLIEHTMSFYIIEPGAGKCPQLQLSAAICIQY